MAKKSRKRTLTRNRARHQKHHKSTEHAQDPALGPVREALPPESSTAALVATGNDATRRPHPLLALPTRIHDRLIIVIGDVELLDNF